MINLIPTKNGTRKTTFAMRLMEKMTKLNYATLFGVWTGLVLLFAAIYFLLTYVGNGAHGPNFFEGASSVDLFAMPHAHRFYNALYYSVITATSTGYGDIVPHGFSKIIASLQSISALMVFAIFVTKLVSHQQEVTLTEVHRLTFEDVFHNSREGMFIARKDFDHIIQALNAEEGMSNESWENLIIAYQQLQTLFEEIPDFYQNEVHRYTIDKKREDLLLEASHRTLHRINQMLDTMSTHNVDWVSHEASMRELQELVRIVNDMTPIWKARSPYQAHEAFEDILQMKERVHLKVLNAID